ncbi:hypothetical protein GDO81_021946 [Engystomops pustulosus]|uniref:Uncharacterized protein n=1 Tax=Engystomops pustulosus TaxID=76066 RepID=A0AAV6YYL2_ENGPU|nr:hypothetical protein GDO81_021946 [Engystomops pustulosus]
MDEIPIPVQNPDLLTSSKVSSDPGTLCAGGSFHHVAGGLFVGLPQEVPRSRILSEPELQFYVSQFKKSGFRGPLNWYRNMDRTWEWAVKGHNWKVRCYIKGTRKGMR